MSAASFLSFILVCAFLELLANIVGVAARAASRKIERSIGVMQRSYAEDFFGAGDDVAHIKKVTAA